MKRFLFIVFLGLNLLGYSQGNLQFNQALLLNATANNSTQWTVPAGKVWKLESVSNALICMTNRKTKTILVAFAKTGGDSNE